MLDLRFIREETETVKENCHLRRIEADVDRLVELAARRAEQTTTLQDLQRQQNEVAKKTGKAKDPEERKGFVEEGKRLKAEAAAAEEDNRKLGEEIAAIQRVIPNLTHPDVPPEEDAVLREVGTKPNFDFKPLDHVELCDRHRLANFEAGAKVAGADFYYLTGDGALLQMALVQYAMKKLVGEGFTPVITPDLARDQVVAGTGFTPRGPETQIYAIEETDLCLVATAEITLAGMYRDEIITATDLPIQMAGLSHCFRTEAGAAGRATRGLYRVHQFTKVEMFAFTLPEESDAMHQRLLKVEEEIFQGLNVPYRVLDIAANDLGGPAYRKFDLEAWMPGRGDGGEYGEVTSTSNCTDYQARRLNIRFKTPGQKGTTFVHMLNGTAVAAGRAMIAVLENNQQADGTIRVPEALVPFMGKDVIGSPAS
ncbi:Serine--tRNA ligase [Planctomycetes bacterium Pan216]|uniref:Serine--tRNA ligase n=1 Tax=Kolteria novifilia TaxID=2527975 RepID=A0A518AZB4_9BACT|nr:Serine--tRNA ligase [Planctomycetes bacterium Pan216]